MNEAFIKIKKDISDGFTEEALNKAISFAKEHHHKKQLNNLTILRIQFQDYQREYLGGLVTGRVTQNRIDLAILTIIDSIERLNKPPKGIKKEKFKGKIIYLNYDQKFGFIKSSDLKNEIYFHFSSSKNELKIKQKVYFYLDKNLKGWYATNVEIDSNFKGHFLENQENDICQFLIDSKELIFKGKVKEAIELVLLNIPSNDSNTNKFIILASRWNKLDEKDIEGVISFDEYSIEYNKINSSILKLIDKIES